MTDEDIFFTHTIVGHALSIELGRPLDRKLVNAQTSQPGLQTNLTDGVFSLSQVWKDWCLIQGAYPYAGRPRRRPGSLRRLLERHALVIAVVGLITMICTTGLLAALVFFPNLLALSSLLPTALIGPKL